MNLNFLIKTLTNKDIIAIIKDAVKNLEKEEVDKIFAKISLTLQNSEHCKDNLSKSDCKTLKILQTDRAIVVLPAEKDSAFVILKREDY